MDKILQQFIFLDNSLKKFKFRYLTDKLCKNLFLWKCQKTYLLSLTGVVRHDEIMTNEKNFIITAT